MKLHYFESVVYTHVPFMGVIQIIKFHKIQDVY